MTAPTYAPVVVVGGGPAGVSAACELLRRGITPLLLERGDGGGTAVGESLAPSANPLLHALGLHAALLASNPLPCPGNRSAWGGDGALTDHDFLREPSGTGWHLDRPAFNAALLAAAADAGAAVWRQARVTSLARDDNQWQAIVETSCATVPVIAGLLVDATGRAAVVSRRQGVRRRAFDSLVAAVAILSPSKTGIRDATTLVEAMECGWWYSALLPDGRLVVAWFTDPDLLAHSAAWRPPGWWALLETSEITRERVASHRAGPSAAIQVVAAGSGLLPKLAGDGWIAAGDAAVTFDPLSSHGIGSALAGGRRAASAVAAALSGDEAAFSAYTDQMFADYAHFLWLRHAYYAEERRWPNASFWARRHGKRAESFAL